MLQEEVENECRCLWQVGAMMRCTEYREMGNQIIERFKKINIINSSD